MNAQSSRPADQDPAEIAKFDAAAHRFWDPAGEFAALHALNPLRTAFVRARAPLQDRRVLDVGCGGGLLAEALAAAQARVTAIDLAPAMIETARLHAAGTGVAIDYRVSDAGSVARQEPAAFDVVTCMEMLEHVPEPAMVLDDCARLLRPGGALFVSTINRNLRSFLLAIVGAEYLARLLPRGTHEYERLIRPSELARWARAAGLDLREIAGLEYNPVTGQWHEGRDARVNYIAYLVKPLQ